MKIKVLLATLIPLALLTGCSSIGPEIKVLDKANTKPSVCKTYSGVVDTIREAFDSYDPTNKSATSIDDEIAIRGLGVGLEIEAFALEESPAGDGNSGYLNWALVRAGSCLTDDELSWLRDVASSAEKAGI